MSGNNEKYYHEINHMFSIEKWYKTQFNPENYLNSNNNKKFYCVKMIIILDYYYLDITFFQ